MNTTGALYFQSQVPLSFWGDCILTAVYLINRTSSKLLQWKSTFQKLNTTTPDYNSLRVFVSLCYASSLSHNRSKFQPRVIPFAFIGYTQGMKAYKLYDIEHKKVFISKDVIFHETTFPFHNIPKTQILVDPLPDFSLPKPFHECNSLSHTTLIPTSTLQTNATPIRDKTLEIVILNLMILKMNSR